MEGQRRRYLAAILAMVVASCFLYLVPLVPQLVLDGVIADPSDETTRLVASGVELLGGRDFVHQNLWWPAVVLLVVTGLAGLFTYLRGRWAAQASEAVVRNLRERVFDHMQRARCSFHDGAKTGDLVQRCTSDVETLRAFFSLQVVEVGRAMIMLVVPIPLMLMIDARMTLISLACVPLVFVFSVIFFIKVRAAFKKKDEAEGGMTARVQENLTGIRVVRAFGREKLENERFALSAGLLREHGYRMYVLMAWYWASSDFLCFLQKALVVALGVYLMSEGSLAPGAFFYFLTAVTMFIWPVRMMGRILADLGKAQVALGRISEILSQPTEGSDEALLPSAGAVSTPAASRQSPPAYRSTGDAASPGPALEPSGARGAVELEGVCFSYSPGGPAALRDVTFEVRPNETVAIVGPSGCGKSTIVNLLLRFYDHYTGSIRLDGVELRDMDPRDVRSRMSVVMQESFIYSKTLGDNIRISRPTAPDREIAAVARVARVHDSIEGLSDGYGTLVGERGMTLSGGQRQRVTLARALLRRPDVLVLDDALSAVDNETEMMIVDGLWARDALHTTILVSHRLSLASRADRVLVMAGGRIVQSGSHRELIERPGPYLRAWEIQKPGSAPKEPGVEESRA